jgi:catechol 2,3-dioxygenase-like lactoylglutathione lyase family enzyme
MPYRILVHDKDQAVRWYAALGFEVAEEWGPAFAILKNDQDELWISGPQTSAAKPMPNGDQPVPGGWNRLVVHVSDLQTLVKQLKEQNTEFLNEPITGPGGSQVLIKDPSGNPVELFQARD